MAFPDNYDVLDAIEKEEELLRQKQKSANRLILWMLLLFNLFLVVVFFPQIMECLHRIYMFMIQDPFIAFFAVVISLLALFGHLATTADTK